MSIQAKIHLREVVVVEGKSLLERNSLEKLRDLVTDLQLVDGTRGLVDTQRLALLRPGGLLLNFSRAAIVDEQAVLDALKSVGVHELDMPASPSRVWEAIQKAKA